MRELPHTNHVHRTDTLSGGLSLTFDDRSWRRSRSVSPLRAQASVRSVDFEVALHCVQLQYFRQPGQEEYGRLRAFVSLLQSQDPYIILPRSVLQVIHLVWQNTNQRFSFPQLMFNPRSVVLNVGNSALRLADTFSIVLMHSQIYRVYHPKYCLHIQSLLAWATILCISFGGSATQILLDFRPVWQVLPSLQDMLLPLKVA